MLGGDVGGEGHMRIKEMIKDQRKVRVVWGGNWQGGEYLQGGNMGTAFITTGDAGDGMAEKAQGLTSARYKLGGRGTS